METPPVLKAEGKPIEITKEESRQAYKARQLSYIPSPTPMPKDGSTVILTGFKSSNRCYIRPADAAVTEEYNAILKKIDNFGKNSSDVSGVPKANTFAVAQRNEKWCRVQILSVRPENRVRVHFIDYGVISVKYIRELKRISGNISSLPCYVNMVQLHGVTVYSMETKVLQQLSQNVDKAFKIRIVDPDEKSGNIQLYHMDTNRLLNTEIIQICQECSDENEPTSNTSTTSIGNDESDNVVGTSEGKEISVSSPLDKEVVRSPNTDKTPRKSVKQSSTPESLANKNVSPVTKEVDTPCMVPVSTNDMHSSLCLLVVSVFHFKNEKFHVVSLRYVLDNILHYLFVIVVKNKDPICISPVRYKTYSLLIVKYKNYLLAIQW